MAIDLRDLTLDNISVWPMPVKAGVIALVCLMIICIAYWLDMSNQQQSLQQVEQQEVALKATYEQKQQKSANLEAYKAQMAAINAEFSALLSELPGSSEVPGLVEDISRMGLIAHRYDGPR